MPKSYSPKRERDAFLHDRWDAKLDEHFERLGISKESIKAAQLGLEGHIVVPGDPAYDEDRMLINPVFDPSPCFIVCCKTVPDVAIALTLARASGMPFTFARAAIALPASRPGPAPSSMSRGSTRL